MDQTAGGVQIRLKPRFHNATVNAFSIVTVVIHGASSKHKGECEMVRRMPQLLHLPVHGESSVWVIGIGESSYDGIPHEDRGAIDAREER